MACTSHCTELYDNVLKKLLKMSMVPIPCQEYSLKESVCTRLECLEWVLDLKEKIPIWSRLVSINTSGYNRKLPMSMCRNYDIEIKGRLWSLWGDAKFKKVCKSKSSTEDKSYLATTVIGLCAATVFRLDIWNTILMNCIASNGQTFFKNSLKEFSGKKCEFHLEDLGEKCSLEGLNFKICMRTVKQGCLYCNPFRGGTNLAFALINFLSEYQFGLLECANRVLGFGCITGPEGSYFMFDAQSRGCPLFKKNESAPYLLRTNHIQILLYCLIITLNCANKQANFCLHNVQIEIINPDMPKYKCDPCKTETKECQCMLPEECRKVPSINCCDASTDVFDELAEMRKLIKSEPKPSECEPKYRRKAYNITKEQVANSIIKPLIDADRCSDEDLKESSDFLKIICSGTLVPLTEAEKAEKCSKSFVIDLNDAFVTGP